MKRSLGYVAVYVLGILVLGGWVLVKLSTGFERDDIPLMIVLPLAWTFSYFPILGSLLAAKKAHALSGLIEQMAERSRIDGKPTPEQMRELEETFTVMAAQETVLPEFVVRRVVRKMIAVMMRRARDGEGDPSEKAAPRDAAA